MTTRLFIAALALLGIYAGARWVRDRGIPTEPAPLEMKAEDLPRTFGDWKGEDAALDPEMFTNIGCTMAIDRMYKDRGGRAVTVHLAVFERLPYGPAGPPHLPEVCYPGAGWRLGEPKSVSLDQGDARGNVAKLLPVERQHEAAYVLYWYQMDGEAYYDGNSQRRHVLACRGRAFLPPIVKVMLQTSAANADEAEKTLKSFAGEVYNWTRNFH
jgi:EpsI family protein